MNWEDKSLKLSKLCGYADLMDHMMDIKSIFSKVKRVLFVPMDIKSIFSKVKRVLFVPYALHNRDEYAATARKAFTAMGKTNAHMSCIVRKPTFCICQNKGAD